MGKRLVKGGKNDKICLKGQGLYPNFNRVIEASGNGMISLEPTRDGGKPVDVPDIYGAISDRQAIRIEDYLWSQIPEASYLRETVGQIEGPGRSHPLALTQLLVAYHMVKAALGEHALQVQGTPS